MPSLFTLIATWEGKENVGYKDIVGVPTACYGDTQNVEVGKRYTDTECLERLDRQIANHAAPVLNCTPNLRDPARRSPARRAANPTRPEHSDAGCTTCGHGARAS